MFVEKVLSIRVLKCELIRVGVGIWATKVVGHIWCSKSGS